MFGCVWTELSTLSKSTWAMPNRILYIFRNKPLYCLDSVYFLKSKHLINILWYKSLTYIFDINRPHMFTTKMEWFYNGTLNWKAHLFLFRLGQKILNLVTRHKKVLFISTIFLPLFFFFFWHASIPPSWWTPGNGHQLFFYFWFLNLSFLICMAPPNKKIIIIKVFTPHFL